MTLEELRAQIDVLDQQLVELLSERARAALMIGHLKVKTSLPVYEPAREKIIYANIRAANKGPLPDIENKITRVNLHANYVLDKRSELRFDYIFERWQTDDWTWMFADRTPFTYGTTTDGTQVLQDPRQTSNFVGVRYIYRFQ